MIMLFFLVCAKQIYSIANVVAQIKFVYIYLQKYFGFAIEKEYSFQILVKAHE